MHIIRGATAIKNRGGILSTSLKAYAAADTSRYFVDSTGFVELSEGFKFLVSITHYFLTSDADIY